MKNKPLTKTDLVMASLKIINADGITQLSMRRLASELHIEAASLYYHVPSRLDLEQLIVDHIINKLILTSSVDYTSWQEALGDFAKMLRKGLKDDPGAVSLVAIHSPTNSLELVAPLIAIMEKSGITTQQALYSLQSVAVFVTGHALAEFGDLPKPPPAPQSYYDAWFEFGKDALIRGIEQHLTCKKRAD